MGDDKLAELLKDVIVDRIGIDRDIISDESDFIDDLGFDSLDIVEYIMECESVFDINISDEDAAGILTFGDAVEYLHTRLL